MMCRSSVSDAQAASDPDLTQAGPYIGRLRADCVEWLGIRYAHSPRFALPVGVEHPSAPVHCDAYGAAPAQLTIPGASASLADDALFLNVWSPAADRAQRPVLVWIHGGGFQSGDGSHYDGAMFAARGDIVVVTINYRLGVLGFVDFSALGVPPNLGLRDQLMALQWVRENIALFGGDPDRVTVAGESAGAVSISLLMLSQEARGQFHQAILQSGTANLAHDAAAAQRLSARYLALLGPDGESAERLRQVDITRLLNVQRQVQAELCGSLAATPVLDGVFLPADLPTVRQRDVPDMPLMLGSNREEIRFFELPPFRHVLPRQRHALLGLIRCQLGAERAEQIAAAYGNNLGDERELATDACFAQALRHVAERHAAAGRDVWVYRFDAANELMGAAHAMELLYLWPIKGFLGALARGNPMVGARLDLAGRMRSHWIHFVRHGRPGPGWHRYAAPARCVHVFDLQDRSVCDPEPVRRLAWSGQDIMVATP